MTTPSQPNWPPEPGYPAPRPTNGFAIASLVLGIVGFIFVVPSILALIFGYIARSQIKERGENGAGLAIAGIVLGWVVVGGLAVIFVIGALIGLVGAASGTR
jgi:hypothetical protein